MVETIELESKNLNRTVRVDLYRTAAEKSLSLLLMNDGQDLVTMDFDNLSGSFNSSQPLAPLLVAGIHCGPDRMNEYGMAAGPDYKGRGARAAEYQSFVIDELLPAIRKKFADTEFTGTSFAGFSLGALSAMDIAWNNPQIFSKVGVFSGSLWWRSLSQDDKDYNQSVHRMMHAQVRNGTFRPGMKFFFECGAHDENMDRNKNGVIDSIDDTIDLMRELIRKGYREGRDIYYLQVPDGRHDVPSWAKAMPVFLNWGWRKNN